VKARHLIGTASFGPEKLNILYRAFDEAWNDIAPNFGDNRLAIEAARVRLANVILAIAQSEGSDRPLAHQELSASDYGEGCANRGKLMAGRLTHRV